MNILLSELSPHPLNREFARTGEKWEQMVGSVREHGVIQKPMVRPWEEGYQIVFGHRRVAASEEAGHREVDCEIREIDDRTVLELLVIENLERENPDPVEEGKLLRALVAEGVDVTILAHRLKRSVEWITTRQRLLDLGDEVLEAVRKPKEERGHMDMGTVRVILSVPDRERERAIQLVLHPEWTQEVLGQREAESVIRSVILEPARKKAVWEKESPGLVKAWKKALGEFLTKEQKKDLIVQALRYEEVETCKMKTGADELIPAVRLIDGGDGAMRWVHLALRHGLPVWVVPAEGSADAEIARVVVDERLLVMAEEAAAEPLYEMRGGVKVMVREHAGTPVLITGKMAKPKAVENREQRIEDALSEMEGGGYADYKEDEPTPSVMTPGKEDGIKIEQSFKHSVMIDMGTVKRLAMWAVSTDSDPASAPEWVPQWAKDCAFAGDWNTIDHVCNWVKGLKG